MKHCTKIFAALLLAALLLVHLAACGGDKGTGDAPEDSGKTSEAVPEQTLLKVGTYKFTNIGTGKEITYNQEDGSLTIGRAGQHAVGINAVMVKGERKYVLEFVSGEDTTDGKGKQIVNYEMNKKALTVSNFGKKEVAVESNEKKNTQQWTIEEESEGVYVIRTRANDKFLLSMTEDALALSEGEVNDSARWKIESIATDNDFYLEYSSDEGNVAVRLALDMLEKTPITAERVTAWANDIEKVLDAYEELTSFHAQDTVFIHAYNYQGVMAGVIGTDQVYVNCGPGEWFYTDMEKMAKRDELGVHDVNFMCLHEIGHLFDYDRGWNFESEMTADLKAAYALSAIEGSVAAPSEFEARDYFDYENIHTAYERLGGGRMTREYSIYRLAELMTNISYEIGWDPFKKTFAWFQSLSPAEYPETGSAKFDTFLDKLSEYSGKDVPPMIPASEREICREKFDAKS